MADKNRSAKVTVNEMKINFTFLRNLLENRLVAGYDILNERGLPVCLEEIKEDDDVITLTFLKRDAARRAQKLIQRMDRRRKVRLCRITLVFEPID